MKFVRILSVGLLSFIPHLSFAQEYSYTHYNISEGLAGSTVYCITQDKDGFIWVGTESGVSRFDGTHFKNFTSSDGLPDIEILQIFADSRGRVWMAPFNKSVCYYYKGEIHNQQNDTLLRKIHLNLNVEGFAENEDGDVLIYERTSLKLIKHDYKLITVDSIGNEQISSCIAVSKSNNGQFWIQDRDHVFEFSPGSSREVTAFSMKALKGRDAFSRMDPTMLVLSPRLMVWWAESYVMAVGSLDRQTTTFFDEHNETNFRINYSIVGDSLVFFNTLSGSIERNMYTGVTRKYLEGIDVSRAFRDTEGNLWFTTLSQGIYRLNSTELKNVVFEGFGGAKCSVYAIAKNDSELFVGTSRDLIFRFPLRGGGPIRKWWNQEAKNRNLFLFHAKGRNWIVASDYGLGRRVLPHTHTFLPGIPGGIKSVSRKNEDEMLIGCTWGACTLDLKTFRGKDTIWHERTTAVLSRNDTSYIGTLGGLYRIDRNRSITYLGEKIPFFRQRIACIGASNDGTLWIAAYNDAGIVGYRNGRIERHITVQQGLTSNMCRTINCKDNTLWIGTDKGLNKVVLTDTGYLVTRYTSTDGLGSNVINTVFIDSPAVYIGTPAGMSVFDDSRIKVTSPCHLEWIAATSSGKDRMKDTANLSLRYYENNIHFEFVGISYKSGGDITYRCRLLGLDNNWRDMKETFLNYPTLPGGQYELQVLAINKYGVHSDQRSLRFTVFAPFWRTVWFDSILMIVAFSCIWLFAWLRIKGIRRRQAAKEELNQRMLELEHKALQAQMNPHFIFNCLNSIQQYIFGRDVLAANKYIAGLAKLIRATLNNSSVSYISLAEEIDFMSTYLSLEKLRFKDKMDWSIEVDPLIDKNSLHIPPMLIQPYAENSMRHGLRHKTDGKGHIRIKMEKMYDGLRIVVEDNGIGRKKAALYKTAEHIEYQSKGMLVTEERIRMMNAAGAGDITLKITDLEDENGNAPGTRVVIEFRSSENT